MKMNSQIPFATSKGLIFVNCFPIHSITAVPVRHIWRTSYRADWLATAEHPCPVMFQDEGALSQVTLVLGILSVIMGIHTRWLRELSLVVTSRFCLRTFKLLSANHLSICWEGIHLIF